MTIRVLSRLYLVISLPKTEREMGLVHYIPIATAIFSAFFFVEIFQHWQKSRYSIHLAWWTAGIFFYGAGPVTESINTIAGYYPANFRAWYIFGAILGGAPLAQGTVYLLFSRKVADRLSLALVTVIVVASLLVLFSPLEPVNVQYIQLSGKLLKWSSVRVMIPFINVYGIIFLVGGAIYSATLYYRKSINKSRFWGNVMIALGGILPGIGGVASKLGSIELLYLSGFAGICCIHAGYQIMKSGAAPSIYSVQTGDTNSVS